jgi:putative phosphoesterase
MLIGIFSDTHDNLTQIDKAIDCFRQRNVEAVLHAGDIVAPFAAKRIVNGINVPLHVVYGNNDGEKEGLKNVLPQIQKGPVLIPLNGIMIAMAHDFSQISKPFRDQASILVAGHTHIAFAKMEENKLMINPGECGGWLKGRSTIAILDSKTLKVEIIDLPL